MRDPSTPDETRRRLLRALALAPLALAPTPLLGLAACSAGGGSSGGSPPGTGAAAPTLACGDDDDAAEATAAEIEGPYFTPNSPERASLLEPGLGGTRLVLSGLVLTRSCRPVERALLDFWQADDGGNYDNEGFRLRGHQFSDAAGAYRLETVVPGLYPGRTRHIHVKVQAPGRPVLTTQLYFPGEAGNARDRFFHDSLLLQLSDAGAGREGRFNFVLDLA